MMYAESERIVQVTFKSCIRFVFFFGLKRYDSVTVCQNRIFGCSTSEYLESRLGTVNVPSCL